MRTTLSLEEDVDRMLRDICRRNRQPLKRVVNEALRLGLSAMTGKRERSEKPYRIQPVSLGEPRLQNMDNIAEVIAVAEGERYR
ncbi:MAG: hypothetical protein JXR96_10775 [Deltaproteobacteria bacterium]|nr:hypothetical protein [Deltaproteobacteria bacterium]